MALGAFGAHALEGRLDPDLLAAFETGVRYQFYHVAALATAAWAASRQPDRRLAPAAGVLFILGIVLFSGSLYALALSGERWLGAVTPLGGLAFIGGWLCLAAAAWTSDA